MIQIHRKQGWELNPNDKTVNAILKRVELNNGECPCQNNSVDKHCPCSDYREKGLCHCGLYLMEMKRLFFTVYIIICCISCDRPSMAVRTDNSPQQLKQRIDSAEMKSYWDKTNDVEVFYPDFFNCADTTEVGTARFHFPSEKEKELSLVYFVEPNVDGWSIHEAVENLSDSVNICEQEGKDFFIMSGQFSQEPRGLFLEKCYLIGGKWFNYTLYYLSSHESSIGRLLDMVKEWNPKHSTEEDGDSVVEMDSTTVSLTTFGLEFTSDPRLGFKDGSVKMPNLKGLHTSSRWAYCKKDSCNTGYYVVGIRCPQEKHVRSWVDNKLWDTMKEKGYEKKAPRRIVNNTSIPIHKVSDFYLNQWQSFYNHYLNDFIICENDGKYPTEQFGLIITDVWQNGNYYTMCVHDWYDMMSNGCPYTTSFYTINASTGKEVSLNDIVSIKDNKRLEKLLKGKLAWMRKQRCDFPLQKIDFLEECTGVALVKEGLLIYFHPYTIGVGSEGQYNVVIPYGQLEKNGINIVLR